MIGYLAVIPTLMWMLAQLIQQNTWVNKSLKVYNAVCVSILVILIVADAELYHHWGQKINSYATSFAKFPKDMLAFSAGRSTWQLVLTAALFSFAAYFIYHKGMRGLNEMKAVAKWKPIAITLVVLALLFMAIRGGIAKTPISQSSAFYSSQVFLNHAAVNTMWNFMASMLESSTSLTENPYTFTDANKAEQLLKPLQTKEKGAYAILNQPKPNILLIILEGWTADVVEAVGGEQGVTPNLNAWTKEGILFTRFYASGNRTDKGLAAILSSQPALPSSSIINTIEKFTALPSISGELKKLGYQTAFYYGGNSDFANMKGYWLSCGFDKIHDLGNFSFAERQAEWGVHDDVLWKHTLAGIVKLQQPFMAGVLTLSSHEPFRVPIQYPEFTTSEGDEYRNAVKFSDESLGAFLTQAKQQPWYDNTLIVILSDHGHKQPQNRQPMEPEHYHIPCLMLGGALKPEFKGTRYEQVTSQTHLAATLLGQLHIPHNRFNWSSNMFDSAYVPYAAFVYYPGVGMIRPDASAVWSAQNKIIERSSGDSTQWNDLSKQARAYLQVYYDEFLKR